MEKLQTMDAKKILVSFLTIVSVLFLVVSVSAATSELITIESVEVDGMSESWNEDVSVVAGEKVSIEVIFEALEDASDVRIKAELQGSKVDSEVEVFVGDVEEGKRYKRTLNLRVPYELKDEASDEISLDVKVWNGDFKTEFDEIVLRVQRPAYNVGVMSISTSQAINAGETFPVDVVLKNIGYNDLDDLYVTATISALDIGSRVYFGDLIAIECDEDFSNEENYGVDLDRKCDEDDSNTLRGRLFLEVPYEADAGVYTLEVEVSNDDLSINEVKQIVVRNDLPESVIRSGNELILVNPTNKLKVYKVLPESPATVNENTVVVSAGSSRTVTVDSNSAESFSVSVFSGENLVGTVEFTDVENGVTSSVVVLTVILAIIFVVLLVVLIVLLTRKPEKDEEFSESYY
tara:strand:- start:9333 stop:10547 length:1215 start_codon:yes stop_codon:yes gene_type:complete